ncbi:aminotransferase [Methylopila turkensis]|uniref:Aminotransferase n=1 Tax=Methylopila turkensis TaxID=1437816 RepID=A0A9W6JN73_9HYPH|nr:aminotransferase [Methylopila turkensis]GLK80267.1 aminotransferase [Methylopila turkensis]
MPPIRFNPVFDALPVTVFETMSRLARETGAINLGQGFPDDPGPEDVRAKAAEAALHGWSQYPPMMGLAGLREAAAAHYARWQGVSLDPEREVMVTSGATEALAGALLALVEPGDEVVLIQPMYDAYLPLALRAGATPRFVRLVPPDWRLDVDAIRAAVGPRTKAVVLNNPLNPAGAVYGREDLEALGAALEGSDAVLIADEVWEHVTFDGRAHVSALAIPALRDRTFKIGSAGKIFAMTGWKVGLVCAAPHLMRVLSRAHQFLTFTTPPSLQEAVAYGLGKDDAWFLDARAALGAKRDRFAAALRAAGFAPLASAGTYFLNLDIAPLGVTDDAAFCERLAREAGVAAIPVSAFYASDKVTTVARFCFAKHDATLDAAAARLAAFRF